MNSHKDSFTKLSQLGRLNQKIFGLSAPKPEVSEPAKPELVASPAPAQSTVIGDAAELTRPKLNLPTANSYNAFPTEGEKT